MLNIDQTRLEKVVQEAFDKVGNSRRWQFAICRAKQEIESNPFMNWDGHVLLVLSPSAEIYSANRMCQCRAYRSNQPCWHRAAARLVQRYNENSH